MTPKTRFLTNQRILQILILLNNGPMRPGKMSRAMGLPYRQLVTEYLNKMTRDGLTLRNAVSHHPMVTEYSLTNLGLSFAEAAKPLVQWLDRNSEHVLAQRTASLAAKEVEKFKVETAGDCHA